MTKKLRCVLKNRYKERNGSSHGIHCGVNFGCGVGTEWIHDVVSYADLFRRSKSRHLRFIYSRVVLDETRYRKNIDTRLLIGLQNQLLIVVEGPNFPLLYLSAW